MIEKIKNNVNEGYVNIRNAVLVQSILMVYIYRASCFTSFFYLSTASAHFL